MTTRHARGGRRTSASAGTVGGALLVLLFGLACQPEPTGLRPGDATTTAKGGGGGNGTTTSPPTVVATDPVEAPRDTTIEVVVTGTGFTPGATAAWSLDGDRSHVQVKSTRVVSPEKLVATIVIPADAPLATYDVEVTLSDGKKGVGAELFEVILGDPGASFAMPVGDASVDVHGDGAYLEGSNSVYTRDVCGVNAKIFLNGSGDAIMHTDNPQFSDRKCRHYPRELLIDHGNGVAEGSTVFVNVNKVATAAYTIPIGTTVRRGMNISGTSCERLVFKGELGDGTDIAADSVDVTRVDASTWRVESQPAPNNRAYCKADGTTRAISVRFTITTDRPLD